MYKRPQTKEKPPSVYLHSLVAHLSFSVYVKRAEKLLGSSWRLCSSLMSVFPSSLMPRRQQAIPHTEHVVFLLSMYETLETNVLHVGFVGQPIKLHTSLTYTLYVWDSAVTIQHNLQVSAISLSYFQMHRHPTCDQTKAECISKHTVC